jgi:hypothetical protein
MVEVARSEQCCFYVKDDSVFAGFWGRREPAEFAESGVWHGEGRRRAKNASAGGGRVVRVRDAAGVASRRLAPVVAAGRRSPRAGGLAAT